MTLVSLEKIERRFGDLVVLDGASLRVDERDRLGVIGDNGAGKTTMIRILAGVEETDRGNRILRRGLRIAYGSQIPELHTGVTVLQFVLQGNGEFRLLEQRVRELEAKLAQDPGDADTLQQYGHLQSAFEAGGGYEREHLCKKVLGGLGFAELDLSKDVEVLSGGEASRLVLATLMVQPVDLLILDEPTNHLDLQGIEFLENFVQRHPGAVVAVSHDRTFLDRVATHIVEVDMGKANRVKGNYTAFKKQSDLQLLSTGRSYQEQQEFIKKEMDYIRKHMGSRLTAQAKGRLKRLKRLQLIQRPKNKSSEMKLRFRGGGGMEGQAILEAENLGARIPQGPTLFSQANFRLYHGETLGIVGRNGAGKTTLMRMLANHSQPQEGSLRRSKASTAGYFSQEMSDLPSHGTVLEALAAMATPQTPPKDLRDHLALFLFSGDEVDKQVETMSGGEKRRLCLARLTYGDYDFLCLDEPTNHLDITAREGLEEALRGYPGAVVVISHDRQFLQEVAGRILYVADGGVRVFDSGLSQCMEFLAQSGSQERKKKKAQQKPAPSTAAPSRPAGPEKIRNPLMFKKLEEEIFAMEEELETLHRAMELPENYSDHETLLTLNQQEEEVQSKLQAAYERWENWS